MNFVDKFLAKKASDRPTAREAVILIPTFVKKAYSENSSDTPTDSNSGGTLEKQQPQPK